MDDLTRDLILLNMLQDIGYIRLKALLAEFSTPEAIFNASIERLESIKGIGRKIAESIRSAKSNIDLENELMLIERQGIKIKTIFDKDYPENLKNIYDPPIVLYIKGEIRDTDSLAVAIVGSRRASLYGLRTAERIASELSAYGVTIISGMARGIDAAAHKGAIKSGGRTTAVLGNGLSNIYPPENNKLADEIITNGAIISEFPMEMPPHKGNFPQRNRVISGLSKGVLVVEAAKKSGSLITADYALEEGRDVYAVPGACDAVTSAGANNLIREGAKLVEGAKDILEELGISLERPEAKEPVLIDSSEKDIYSLLSDKPRHIDDITGGLSITPKKAGLLLLNLEMKGVIKQLPGKLYVRA